MALDLPYLIAFVSLLASVVLLVLAVMLVCFFKTFFINQVCSIHVKKNPPRCDPRGSVM